MKVCYKAILIFILLCTTYTFVGCKSQDVFTDAEEEEKQATKPNTAVLEIQKKYAMAIGVGPSSIKNIELYKFIDKWMETPYLLGGETKNGIDCSFFTQFLYHDVYNSLIERTAEKQYVAPSTDKFIGQEYLKEGDLLFFNKSGSEHLPISHVGVYLGNSYFVHSTAKKSRKGINGVQISNLRESYWQRIFVAAGRKRNKPNIGINR